MSCEFSGHQCILSFFGTPCTQLKSFFYSGDVVFVMEKCDDGWFVGTSQRTGIFGTFPGNYVTQV